MKKLTSIVFLLFCRIASASDVVAVQAAFEDMQAKYLAFDAKATEYFLDEAVLENTRHYPSGKERKMTLTGAQFKSLIKSVMPMAKAKGDVSKYKNVTYTLEGEKVIVKATRWSVLKQYDSPYEAHFILVDGKARIVKEISASKR